MRTVAGITLGSAPADPEVTKVSQDSGRKGKQGGQRQHRQPSSWCFMTDDTDGACGAEAYSSEDDDLGDEALANAIASQLDLDDQGHAVDNSALAR